MAVVGRDGGIVRANEAMCTTLGRTSDDVRSSCFAALAVPAHGDDVRDALRQVFAGEVHGTQLEAQFARPEGSARWLLLAVSPVIDSGGEISTVLCQTWDIDGPRRAERKLRRTHRPLRAALDATTDAVYLKDLDGRYVMINRAGAATAGLTPDAFLGRRDEDIFAPVSVEKFREVDLGVLASGETTTMEETLSTPAGIRIFQSTKGVYLDDDGEVAGLLGISRDITEWRQADNERQRRNGELESFASLAAHDLRQPLQVVGGFTQLLAERYAGQLDDRADRYLDAIGRGVDTMTAMVESLLEFAQAGEVEPTQGLTDSGQIVAEVVEGLHAAVDVGQVVVRSPLPVLPTDPAQLSRLFQNLIGNGLKFRGEEPPRVEVAAERSGGDWIFRVSDNGMGIDPGFAAQIFGMFQRERRGDRPGTGMGLAICKRIVEHHGGRIWFDSVPGQGSTFSFSLPASAR